MVAAPSGLIGHFGAGGWVGHTWIVGSPLHLQHEALVHPQAPSQKDQGCGWGWTNVSSLHLSLVGRRGGQ